MSEGDRMSSLYQRLDLHWLWMDGWMDAIKHSGGLLCTSSAGRMKDGSCCLDAAEDDDGLDGMDETVCIFDQSQFATMDDIGCWSQDMHSSKHAILEEDVYDGSNQGFNDATVMIPTDSM
ncbi:predicted protein [Lichtheimia corymbifera JMRC:FSU:9682]|uniref:Uncharacterized protein n=1 Tax=Lichtheimia corymbifera JMRC:FSU:9682 TaxID=1263082 RepID=A0A068RHQ6_9FUNG|nr:predicted protein [Lichtheimia corymbifera JMRC:FSU:9682]